MTDNNATNPFGLNPYATVLGGYHVFVITFQCGNNIYKKSHNGFNLQKEDFEMEEKSLLLTKEKKLAFIFWYNIFGIKIYYWNYGMHYEDGNNTKWKIFLCYMAIFV